MTYMYPYDAIQMGMNDIPEGYLIARTQEPIPFLPIHPLKNDVDRSVFDDVPPPPDIRPWYVKDGFGV
jgi:hypothetical protein